MSKVLKLSQLKKIYNNFRHSIYFLIGLYHIGILNFSNLLFKILNMFIIYNVLPNLNYIWENSRNLSIIRLYLNNIIIIIYLYYYYFLFLSKFFGAKN